MNYRTLGTSELSISEISFGCMSLENDDEENRKLLHHAIDRGINYFDTADVYGKGANEITLGKILKDVRPKIILATKVGNQWNNEGTGFHWNPTKSYILKTVEESLTRLQTDYIDLYQLHGGTMDDPIDEIIEAFDLLKQQGKIRYYGISSIRPNVIREYVKRSSIVSVMMQYSLLDRRPEESCLDLLHENKVGVLARGALAKGLLVNKPAEPFLNYTTEEVNALQDAIKHLCNEKETSTKIAVQFVLQHPAISSAVVGMRTMEQLHDVLNILPLTLMDSEKHSFLRNILRRNVYDQHR